MLSGFILPVIMMKIAGMALNTKNMEMPQGCCQYSVVPGMVYQ
jgi:hypothetical protein